MEKICWVGACHFVFFVFLVFSRFLQLFMETKKTQRKHALQYSDYHICIWVLRQPFPKPIWKISPDLPISVATFCDSRPLLLRDILCPCHPQMTICPLRMRLRQQSIYCNSSRVRCARSRWANAKRHNATHDAASETVSGIKGAFSLSAQSVLLGWLFPLHNNTMVLALGAIRMDIGFTSRGIVNKFLKHTAVLLGQAPFLPAGLVGPPKTLKKTAELMCYSG